MAELKLRGVAKRYGRADALCAIDLDIADREFLVVVGPSGCGKSTLLRLIAGLDDVTAGEIEIDGVRVNDLPPVRRGVAMVFQSYALYPHMTAYENMSFGLQLARVDKSQIDRRVHKAAEILAISGLLDRKPRELSGGQRQRVAIGRAITREPKVFLLDEPLSNLDASLRVQMRAELAKLHSALDVTTVYVTHDQVEAMTLADRIALLREGRIEQVGTPLELYRRPANLFVAGFIGSPAMNLIAAAVVAVGEGTVTLRLPGGGAIEVPAESGAVATGTAVTLGIRPEHLNEGGTGEALLSGTVTLAERLGGSTLLHVHCAENIEIMVQVSGDSAWAVGDHITLGVQARSCHLFAPSGNRLRPWRPTRLPTARDHVAGSIEARHHSAALTDHVQPLAP